MGSPDKVKAPAILKWGNQLISSSDVDKELFERQLIQVALLSRSQTLEVMKVFHLAAYAHEHGMEGKKTRGTGEPFFDHPKGVALMGIWEFQEKNPLQIQLDLVHDVLDYSNAMSEDLWQKFLGPVLFRKLKTVSKPEKGEDEIRNQINKRFYYKGISEDAYTMRCKAKDRIYNFRTIQGVSRMQALRKIKITERQLIPAFGALEDPRYKTILTEEIKRVRDLLKEQNSSAPAQT